METAPVSILNPNHQILNFPNIITANDFKGWIQERGLYFVTCPPNIGPGLMLEQVFDLFILRGKVSVFLEKLLDELTFPLGVHRILFVNKIPSLLI
jgi:hypothetical protein